MDHEVEDNIDVERSRREDGQAMRFKEHGPGEAGEGGGDGGVEALEVTGGEDTVLLPSERDEAVSFGECCRDGFFEQDVEPGSEELLRHEAVSDRGDAHGCGLKVKPSGEQIFHGAETGDAVAGGSLGPDVWIPIDKGCQPYGPLGLG